TSSPTSGNAWARRFLNRVFPMPEDMEYYKTCGDEYLYTLAAAFGPIRALPDPQGFYRIHGKNIYSSKSFDEKLRLELLGFDQQCFVLSRLFRDLGISVDLEEWRKKSWWRRLDQASRELSKLIPSGDTFILVDDASWG